MQRIVFFWLTCSLWCLAAVPASSAGSVWCSLSLPGVGFVSDVQQVAQLDGQALRKLASRFRRTVNARYGRFFTSDSGVCRSFPTQSRAELALAALRATLQRDESLITVVGVY